MPAEIAVAVLSLTGTLLGSLAGILTANKLTMYRLEQLEKQVAKHNSVVERVALLEQDDRTQWKRIDELRKDLDEMKDEVYRHAD